MPLVVSAYGISIGEKPHSLPDAKVSDGDSSACMKSLEKKSLANQQQGDFPLMVINRWRIAYLLTYLQPVFDDTQ